jgi:hypothetical protein
VWSTHAVPAAWLATGSVRIDPHELLTYLAAEFVGGNTTLIHGVRAMRPATRVDLGPDGSAEAEYWPLRERWLPVPEHEAEQSARTALIETLARRVAAVPRPMLGLTGGLDSAVVAAALRESGCNVEAFTWGDESDPDVAGARAVAASLSITHSVRSLQWFDDSTALAATDRMARWADGTTRGVLAEPSWPSAMGGFVTGGGGEAGRCFYLRWRPSHPRRPSEQKVASFLASLLLARVPGAGESARKGLRDRVASWVREAHESGHSGWRALDVLYAEQRVRRWGRSMVSPAAWPVLPAFSHPAVLRPLLMLPLEDRMADGFHRRLLARLAPEVPLPDAAGASRRRVARVAARSRALHSPVRRLLLGRAPETSYLASRWNSTPRYRGWLADEVLGAPLVQAGLGDGHAQRLHADFLDGTPASEELAVWAAGPVALERALAALRPIGS